MAASESEAIGLRLHVITLEAILWHALFIQLLSPRITKYFIIPFIRQTEHKKNTNMNKSDKTNNHQKITSSNAVKVQVFSRKEEILLPTYITGMFHASFVVVGAVFILVELVSKGFDNKKYIYGHLDLAVHVAEVFMAYIAQDLVYLIYYDTEVKEKEAIVHHAVYLTIASYTVSYSYLVLPFAWLCLGELSTPFVSMRWILALMGWKTSNVYFYNGLLLMSSFFVTRIVFFGLGLGVLVIDREFWMYPHGPIGLNLVIIGLFLMYGLNLYWFKRIWVGAQKALKQRKVA